MSTRPSEPLTPAEVYALLEACSAAPTGLRNRALIAVMYRCGLRCNEALSLRTGDIDPVKGTIRVLHGKGNKQRVAGADDATFAIVRQWLAERDSLNISEGPLFCTLKGTKLSGRYVRELTARLGRKAGIEKRTNPHGLRHTHASELVYEGVPLNVISKQLGHSNSAVTARYLDHIAPADVIAMGRNRPAWLTVS
jgi:integrase/recombinase XerD